MAGLNGLLEVLGLKLAPIQVISVVATNCKEGSKMLYLILDVGMPRECQALSDCHLRWGIQSSAQKPKTPTGLILTPPNGQISLSWHARCG